MKTTAEVDAYIMRFNGVCQERLEQIRSAVVAIAPNAEEGISYGMPAYKLHGKPLVYFAGYDRHIGLYATPAGHEAFKKEFAAYKQGKGSVQFPHDQPLPMELITRVIAFRVSEFQATLSNKVKGG